MERVERRHLALRAGPQPGPGLGRRDAPALGGARLRSPLRQGQEVRSTRAGSRTPSWAAGSSAPSSATRRASRSSSARASATCPASSGPAASRRSPAAPSFAQDTGSFDPGEGPALRPERVRVRGRLQLLLRHGRPRDELSAAPSYRNQDLRWSRTRASGRGSTCSSGSRPSTSGTGTSSAAAAGRTASRATRPPSSPTWRAPTSAVERAREQPAEHPGGGAAGVLGSRFAGGPRRSARPASAFRRRKTSRAWSASALRPSRRNSARQRVLGIRIARGPAARLPAAPRSPPGRGLSSPASRRAGSARGRSGASCRSGLAEERLGVGEAVEAYEQQSRGCAAARVTARRPRG